MDDYNERLRVGKRGELFVFTNLLQRRVIPYAPLVDIEAIDCLVKKPQGGYLEIQVKTINTANEPMWWVVSSAVPEKKDYILALVSIPLDWACWILPAPIFIEHATGSEASGTYNLNLRHRDRESLLGHYKNNWDLIVSNAEQEPEELLPT